MTKVYLFSVKCTYTEKKIPLTNQTSQYDKISLNQQVIFILVLWFVHWYNKLLRNFLICYIANVITPLF